ncbi:MAG: alkaline phosphatase family protein [Gallionellaceae bacterium]
MNNILFPLEILNQPANSGLNKLRVALLSLCFSVSAWGFIPLGASAAHAQSLPRPDHIVIVVEENKAYSQIIGNPAAPYINQLASRGVLFTQSHGVTHPSQPNYMALFTGSTLGLRSNACPLGARGDNLASALINKGMSFVTYSESMPRQGYEGCSYGAYKRKHNPLANWPELAAYNQPFSAFPQSFENLPTVTLLVPDQRNDMHDGSIAQGDAWLAHNIESYAQWAEKHNSLLIVTWDEDNGSENNRVATILLGQMVKPGSSGQVINHYNLLHTIEEMMGLPYLGESAGLESISGIWRDSGKKSK